MFLELRLMHLYFSVPVSRLVGWKKNFSIEISSPSLNWSVQNCKMIHIFSVLTLSPYRLIMCYIHTPGFHTVVTLDYFPSWFLLMIWPRPFCSGIFLLRHDTGTFLILSINWITKRSKLDIISRLMHIPSGHDYLQQRHHISRFVSEGSIENYT